MSPLHIANPGLYLDRTVQDWHRTSLPEDATAIDLDLMGACACCYESLYLIESATHWQKPVGILRSLAVRATVPALLVVHDTTSVLGARLLEPKRKQYPDSAAVKDVLLAIRRHHMFKVHRGVS